MKIAILIVNATTIGLIVFGNMCLKIIRGFENPNARSASTKASSRREKNSPRTNRKVVIQPVRAKTMITLLIPWPRSETKISTKISCGKVMISSETRITTASILPPKYPAVAPNTVPIRFARKEAITPI